MAHGNQRRSVAIRQKTQNNEGALEWQNLYRNSSCVIIELCLCDFGALKLQLDRQHETSSG